MGVWIELEEGEPIKDALRRFRKLILAEGAYPFYHCRWHKPRRDIYLKPSILGRRGRCVPGSGRSMGHPIRNRNTRGLTTSA